MDETLIDIVVVVVSGDGIMSAGAVCYGRTLSDASMLYFADVFFIFFFMAALVGQTAERIFTKLSHVVDIRCYLRTYYCGPP